MKKIILLLLVNIGICCGQPCTSRACDESVITAIFTANGLTVKLADITNAPTGRVNALSLIDSNIKVITGIGRLVELRDLTIRYTQLTQLPTEMGLLINLRNVVFTDNKKLTSLPKEIGLWQNIYIMTLDRNALASVPAEIGQIKQLNGLTLSGNRLTTVPAEMQNLDHPYFHVLDLSDNLIDSLPVEIGGILGINYLRLSKNRLTHLPAGVLAFQDLWSLEIADNLLTSIPATIGNVKTFKELDFSGNKITVLPAEIGSLPKLNKLIMDNTLITALPPTLWKDTLIAHLELKQNLLTSLSTDISKLKNLKRLLLSKNQITALPASITALTGLYGLEIGYNRLCGLTGPVLTWVDQNSIDTTAWLQTQTTNGTAPCSGVSTIPQVTPFMSEQMQVHSQSHTLTFSQAQRATKIVLQSLTGKRTEISATSLNPATFNYGSLPHGIYLIQIRSLAQPQIQPANRWFKALLD